ncbi:MAG: PAS domain S-box protein [Candidatus Saccharicenans sp.]
MRSFKTLWSKWKKRLISPIYLISLVLILIILVVGFNYYQAQAQKMKNIIQEELSGIAQLKAKEIRDWLDQRKADAEVMSKNPFLASSVINWLKKPDSELLNKIKERLEITSQAYNYDRIMILDQNKIPVISIGEEAPAGAPASFSSELKEALSQAEKTGEVILTDLHKPRPQSEIHMDVVAPIFYSEKAGEKEKTTKPGAFLILTVNANRFLFPLIQTWPIPSSTAETQLVKRDGDDVLYLNEQRHRKYTALKLRFPLTRREQAAVRAASGEYGYFEGYDYRGEKVLAHLTPVPGTSWSIVSKIDEKEALSSWKSRSALIILFIIILTAAGFILAELIWQKREKANLARLYLAEAQVRESRELFRVLTESSLIGVYLIQDGVFQYVNKTLSQWFGYQPEELIGRLGNIDLTHPDDRAMVADYNRRRLEKKLQSIRFDFKALRKDGSFFFAEAYGSVIDYQGKPAIIGSLIDITERINLLQEIMTGEAEMRASLYSIADAVISTDVHGRVRLMNPVAEKLTGWREDEAVEKPIEEIFHIINEFSREPVANPVERVIKEGIVVGLANHTVLISRDGTEYPIADSGAPIFDEEGNILGVILVFRDQTKEREAQRQIIEAREELREKNRFLETLIQNLPGMVYRCKNDRNWTMEYIAGQCWEITGYESEDLIENRRLSYNDLIVPEYRDYIWEKYQRVLKAHEIFEDEYPIITADGKIKWVWERGRGVYDAQGNLICLEGFITDVTEKKKAQEELAKSEKEKSAIFAAIDEHVIYQKPDHTIIWANRAAADSLGLKPEELIGKKCYELWHRRTRPCDICPVAEAHDSGQPSKKEVVTPDGRWWAISGYTLKDERGEVIGMIEVTSEITERKLAEQGLKQSLKEKEILIREIHHRVKNNMQVISSILNLQSALLDDQRAKAAFKECQHRIKSMAMVHEKLYRSKDLSNIDFADYLNTLSHNIFSEQLIKPDQVQLHLDVEPINLNINKAVPLGLIINELITNAFKHAFRGGRKGNLWISLKKTDEKTVELTVKDDGLGFPKGLDWKKAESLGLTIINTLVEQIDGKIELIPDGGTEFKITFPL